MREFGELPHFVEQRLHGAGAAAAAYCRQFPAPVTGAVASLVAYVAAALAGLVIAVALSHDFLMERTAFGHTLVWWLATAGVVLAVARALMEDEAPAYDPEAAMAKVARKTHWMPLYWRRRAHTAEVRGEFQALYQYQLALALEELISVILLPWICWVALPRSADDIAAFLRDCTTYQPGVGHICSMAAFDLARHGNARYGARVSVARGMRSRQGKLEKSLLSFAACYPTWQPADPAAADFISQFEALAHSAAASVASSGHAHGEGGRDGRDSSGPARAPDDAVSCGRPELRRWASAAVTEAPASPLSRAPLTCAGGALAASLQLLSDVRRPGDARRATLRTASGHALELQRVGSGSWRSVVGSTGATPGGFRDTQSAASSSATPRGAPRPPVSGAGSEALMLETPLREGGAAALDSKLSVPPEVEEPRAAQIDALVASVPLPIPAGPPAGPAAAAAGGATTATDLPPGEPRSHAGPRLVRSAVSAGAAPLRARQPDIGSVGAADGDDAVWLSELGRACGHRADDPSLFQSTEARLDRYQGALQAVYKASLPPDQALRVSGSLASYATAPSAATGSLFRSGSFGPRLP